MFPKEAGCFCKRRIIYIILPWNSIPDAIFRKFTFQFINMMTGNIMGYTFSDQLDRDKLDDLYLGDPCIACEVFGAFVTETVPTVPGLQASFLADDKNELRRLIHKIKPGFLYVGLTGIFEKLSIMEDKCESVDSLRSLEAEFREIVAMMDDKMTVVQKELERLKQYSASGV